MLFGQDAYRQKTINMELAKLTGIKGVPVPSRPAPPQSPGRVKKVIPNDFITAKPTHGGDSGDV